MVKFSSDLLGASHVYSESNIVLTQNV